MSYIDSSRRRFDPVGLGAATLITGSAIVALILSVPKVSELLTFDPTTTFEVPPETAKPPEKMPDKPKTRIIEDRTTLPPISDLSPPPLPPAGPKPDEGVDIVTPPTPPTPPIAPLIEPVIPPAPPPVLTTARDDPRYASSRQPEYPPSMIRAELGGRVKVRVRIGTDGRVKEVEVQSADTPEFAEATRRHALKSWRFLPATRDGVPEESWRTLSVRFELPD